jgi:hypothetical protein
LIVNYKVEDGLFVHLDTYVTIPYVVAMVLESDVATVLLTLNNHHIVSSREVATLAELAAIEHFLPLRSPEVILQNLFAILVVPYRTLEDTNLHGVPLAIRLRILRNSRNHVVERRSLAVAVLTLVSILVVGIVEHLVLRARLPDGEVVTILTLSLLGQVEDTGITTLADLILALESEVLELVSEEKVATALYLSLASTATHQVDAAVNTLPTCGNSVLTIATPTVETGAIVKNIISLCINLQLRKVILLVVNDSSTILGSIGILLLHTVLASLAVTVTLVLTTASSQEHCRHSSNINDRFLHITLIIYN